MPGLAGPGITRAAWKKREEGERQSRFHGGALAVRPLHGDFRRSWWQERSGRGQREKTEHRSLENIYMLRNSICFFYCRRTYRCVHGGVRESLLGGTPFFLSFSTPVLSLTY